MECDFCKVKLNTKNICGGGFYPPDCPGCYKMMCKNCCVVDDGDTYCKDCVPVPDDD